MEIAACSILRRFSILAILFLSSIFMLHAQVSIKERVEIKPGVKTLNKSASSSSSSLPCFTGAFDPTSNSLQISVHRNCTVTATGTFERSEEGVPVSDVPAIGSNYFQSWLVNETKTFISPCGDHIGCGMAGLGSCGGLYNINAGGNVYENSAYYDISATWNCVAEHPVQIHATIELHAIPLDNPAAVEMKATPDVIDEYTPSGDGIRRSVINARWVDVNGNNFAACCANVTFRIENPRPGVTLEWTDENGAVKHGDNCEASYCGASASTILDWDGSDLFTDSCEIRIIVEGIGLTAVQKILLKQRYPDHFVVTPGSNSLSLCKSTTITAIATNENDEEVPFDESKQVDIISSVAEGKFIVGSDTIPGKIIVPYEQAKSGTIQYYVDVSPANLNGVQTSFLAYRDDNPPPFCEIWSGHIDIEPSCALLKLSKRTISPGDTVKIDVMASTLKGEFPYPVDQKFNIWLNTGDNWYGSLSCPGKSDTGAFLFNLPEPFEFVATNSINEDSAVVEMGIFVFPPGGPAGSIGIKDTLSGPASVMAKIGTKSNNTIAVSNETNKSKLELSIKKLQSLLDKGISKKSNEKQSQKLAKKIEILKSQLAYETAKTPTEKQNAIANIKQIAMLDGEGSTCQRTAQVTIENNKLVVVYPTDSLLERKDIERDPKMPDITAKAYLKNYKGGEVKFEWNLRVQWIGNDKRKFDTSFHKYYTTANNSDTSSWTIDWNNMTRGGDEITLDVTATADGIIYDKTINHGFKIVGLNPSIAQIKEGLSLEEQVMIYQESLPHWHHFIKDHDFPIFGSPHGYGLSQLDNRATDEQVWNWKENKAAGKALFDYWLELSKHLDKSIAFYDKKGNAVPLFPGSTPPSSDQALRNAYNRYNQGDRYYEWELKDENDPQSGYWKGYPPSPKSGHTKCYADEAMDVYQNQPTDWN